MIRAYDGVSPDIDESAYVDPEATIVGDVTIGPEATVLPGAVLRADSGGEIVLHERANVQDNVTIHADGPDQQAIIEANGAVGHNAIVHNASVGEYSLVGMNATVLDGAILEPYSIVAANSLVTEDRCVERGTLVAGAPASVLRENLEADDAWFGVADRYVDRVAGFESIEEPDDGTDSPD